jgi:Gpi18-like mannosyltransferase
MKSALTLLLIWLGAITIFMALASNRFNLQGDNAYTWIDPSTYQHVQQWNPVSNHTQWDSAFYLDIAQHGYQFLGQGMLSNIVFFPLYPFLVFLIAFLLFGHYALAGWIVSVVALGFAVVFLWKLAKEFHPDIDPELPIVYLLIFPTAVFLTSVYTESLFLFLSIATFYYLFKKNFLLAGIFGLMASLTRVTGVLLFIPLLWEYYRQSSRDERYSLANLLKICLVPLGTFCFLLYHKIAFGDFFLFFKVEKWWGRAFSLNKSHFILVTHPAVVNFSLDIAFVLFGLVAIWFIFKKLPISYGLYALASFCVALATGTTMSIGRYLLVLFPVYIWMASIQNKYIRYAIIFPSILLLGFYTVLFVNGYWAG